MHVFDESLASRLPSLVRCASVKPGDDGIAATRAIRRPPFPPVKIPSGDPRSEDRVQTRLRYPLAEHVMSAGQTSTRLAVPVRSSCILAGKAGWEVRIHSQAQNTAEPSSAHSAVLTLGNSRSLCSTQKPGMQYT